MLSIPSSKDEESKNIFMRIQLGVINQISKWSDITGELYVSGMIYTLLCLIITYFKFIGIVLYRIEFIGLNSQLANNFFKIINLTNFLIDKGILFQLIMVAFFIKNLIFVGLTLWFLIHFNKNSGFALNKSFSILYQFLHSFTFWVSLPFELEIGIYSVFGQSSTVSSSSAVFDLIFYGVCYANIGCSVLISILYSFFFNKFEINIDCEDHMTRQDSNNEIALFALKITYSLLYAINLSNQNLININVFLTILLMFHSLYFILFISFGYYYHRFTQILSIFLNITCIFSILGAFVVHNIASIYDADFIIYCGFLTLFPISGKLHIAMLKYYISGSINGFQSQTYLNRYIAILISLASSISNSKESETKVLFYGALEIHREACIYPECTCKLPEGTVLFIPKNKSKYVIDNINKEFNQIYILHLIKSIFEFQIKAERNTNINFHIMYCYFMNYFIGNFFYSLYFLINLKLNEELNIQQKVSLERILQINNQIFEQNLNKLDLGYKESSEGDIKKVQKTIKIDFVEIITFYTKINSLKVNITNSLDMAFQFWNAILLKMDLITIKKHGLEFSKHNEEVDQTNKEINKIFSGYKEINTLYKNYEAYVFGNTLNINQNEKDGFGKFTEEKYFTKNSIFVIANIADKNKAIIEKITESVGHFLGHNPNECLGQDVKLLMPNYYKIRHSGFLDTHFKTGINKILNSERNVFALHNQGYSVATKIIVKLSNSMTSINYLGYLREYRINYDFIVMTLQGQIILYSRGIFDALIKDHRNYDSTNNYIQFLCKEYLDEIEYIYDSAYEISDLSQRDSKLSKYGYFMIHLGLSKQIEDFLKSDKKGTSHKDNEIKNIESAVPQTLMKLISKREEIKRNFGNKLKTKCLTTFFAKKERINLCQEEDLLILKLYSKLDDEGSSCKDELLEVESYLRYLEKIEEELYLKRENYVSSKNIDFCKDRKIQFVVSDKNISINIMQAEAEEKPQIRDDCQSNLRSRFDPKRLDQTMSIEKNHKKKMWAEEALESASVLSSIGNINENKAMNYYLLKKRFFEKDNTKAIVLSISLNLSFLVIIIVAMILIYLRVFNTRIQYCYSINSQYFTVLDTLSNLIYTNFAIHSISNKNKYLHGLRTTNLAKLSEVIKPVQDDTDEEFERLQVAVRSINDSVRYIQSYNPDDYVSTLSFLTIQHEAESNSQKIIMTIRQLYNYSLLYLYNLLPYIKSIQFDHQVRTVLNLEELRQFENSTDWASELEFLQLSFDNLDSILDIELLISISQDIFRSFNQTIATIQSSSDNRNQYFLIIIILLCILSIISFFKIVFFYFNQNKMISLLFSLDDRIAREILWSIRILKGILLQRGAESEVEDEEDENANLVAKPEAVNKPNEDGSKMGKDKEKDKDKKEDKKAVGDKLELNVKFAKKSKSYMWQVNWSIYFQTFLLLASLSMVSLIPILYYINQSYYEVKFFYYINLLNYYKYNEYNVLMLFTSFYHYLEKEDAALDHSNQINQKLTNEISTFSKNTADNLFNLLSDLNTTESVAFLNFFSIDICINNPSPIACTSGQATFFSKKSYKYIEDVFTGFVSDFKFRKNVDQRVTNLNQMIEFIYSDDDWEYLDNLFEFMLDYGCKAFNQHMINILQIYVDLFTSEFYSIYCSTIILMILYMIGNVLIIKSFNYSVNVEVKKLFSLIPQVVVLSNQGIYELFSS